MSLASLACRRLGLSRGSRCREADAFSAVVVQHFEGIAVEDGDDLAGEVSNGFGGAEQEQEIAESKDIGSSPPHE
jgi:hypothetical protein